MGRKPPLRRLNTATAFLQLSFGLTCGNHALYSGADVDGKIPTVTGHIAAIKPDVSLPHGDGPAGRFPRPRKTRSSFRNLNNYLRHLHILSGVGPLALCLRILLKNLQTGFCKKKKLQKKPSA